LHTENQLPMLSFSALKVYVVGWVGGVGWVVQLITLSTPTPTRVEVVIGL
jgi:hypothetical protein